MLSFALLGWATVLTYERAPPQPERFVSAGGAVLMTADDIFAGKVGFQKADLMDYGSLYGMGSYYGQDYTAWTLIRLAGLTEARIAQARFAKPFDELPPDQQAAVRTAMREQLQRVDLTQTTVSVPDALAGAIGSTPIFRSSAPTIRSATSSSGFYWPWRCSASRCSVGRRC